MTKVPARVSPSFPTLVSLAYRYGMSPARRGGVFAAAEGLGTTIDGGEEDIQHPDCHAMRLPCLVAVPPALPPNMSNLLWEVDFVIHISRVLAAFGATQAGGRHLGRE